VDLLVVLEMEAALEAAVALVIFKMDLITITQLLLIGLKAVQAVAVAVQ
jgi:hypothetical protein